MIAGHEDGIGAEYVHERFEFIYLLRVKMLRVPEYLRAIIFKVSLFYIMNFFQRVSGVCSKPICGEHLAGVSLRSSCDDFMIFTQNLREELSEEEAAADRGHAKQQVQELQQISLPPFLRDFRVERRFFRWECW